MNEISYVVEYYLICIVIMLFTIIIYQILNKIKHYIVL